MKDLGLIAEQSWSGRQGRVTLQTMRDPSLHFVALRMTWDKLPGFLPLERRSRRGILGMTARGGMIFP